MNMFTEKEIEQLIELVSKQRDLYDPNSHLYKSPRRRAQLWEAIGKHLNKSSKYQYDLFENKYVSDQ